MSTSKTPATKPIEIKTWKSQQSAHYQQLANLGKFKVRMTIKRDSYDMQSNATASVWSPEKLEWNVVYSIPYPQMASLKSVNVYSNQEPSEAMFARDVITLISGLKAILF